MNIHTWLCANKLSLNMEKSNFIIFHSVQKRLTYNIKLEINGIELKRTESIRYLGVFLDSNLNGKSHIGYICKKLKRSTGMLFQNSLLYWHQHFSQIVLCINISVFNLWCNYLGHNVFYHIASPICFAKRKLYTMIGCYAVCSRSQIASVVSFRSPSWFMVWLKYPVFSTLVSIYFKTFLKQNLHN
jgi:hypothetical protein